MHVYIYTAEYNNNFAFNTINLLKIVSVYLFQLGIVYVYIKFIKTIGSYENFTL